MAATRQPNPSSAPATSFLDPAALMTIRNLELRARSVVQGFWHGLHRSPYHGFSVEFTEYRAYSPGDDPRYLDWKLVARSDRYYIKKFEDETNLRCHLLVDQSRSMAYGSTGYPKIEYASTLAATLGWFLAQQGDAVGLLTFDEAIRDYLPARNRPGHLRQLMLALEKPASGVRTDLVAPLRRIADLVTKRGLIVLVSDLLAPVDAVETELALLASAGHELVVFQVLDPAETNFNFERASLFHDVESGRDLYIEPALAKRDYLRRLEKHQESLRGMCRRYGISLHQLATDQPLELALFEFLKMRQHRGKHIRRAGA